MRILNEWLDDFLKMGPLGEALVSAGKISPAELAKALKICEEEKQKRGTVNDKALPIVPAPNSYYILE